jgi:hypothetical protein
MKRHGQERCDHQFEGKSVLTIVVYCAKHTSDHVIPAQISPHGSVLHHISQPKPVPIVGKPNTILCAGPSSTKPAEKTFLLRKLL